MAVPNFKAFWPPGKGLQDGNKLNKLFTGQEGIQGLVIQAGGSFTSNAGSIVNGQQKQNLVTVIATGNSVANARTVGVAASLIVVNATASTEGVKLPTPTTGLEITVLAPTAVAVLVYASAAGQSIGTGTTNTTAFKVTANTGTVFYAISKTKWRVLEA